MNKKRRKTKKKRQNIMIYNLIHVYYLFLNLVLLPCCYWVINNGFYIESWILGNLFVWAMMTHSCMIQSQGLCLEILPLLGKFELFFSVMSYITICLNTIELNNIGYSLILEFTIGEFFVIWITDSFQHWWMAWIWFLSIGFLAALLLFYNYFIYYLHLCRNCKLSLNPNCCQPRSILLNDRHYDRFDIYASVVLLLSPLILIIPYDLDHVLLLPLTYFFIIYRPSCRMKYLQELITRSTTTSSIVIRN